jgi:glycosyltransferase involved in cell wall biosynthesis
VRILYLADIRFPLERANGIQTIETCAALARRGHGVRLLVRPDTVRPARDPFAFYDLPCQEGLVVERAPVRGPEAVRRMMYMAAAFGGGARSASRADVVITRDLGVASLVLCLPRSRRAPLVYESHGFAPLVAKTRPSLISGTSSASPSKIRRLLARETRVWRLAEGYVTITQGLATDLEQQFGRRGALAAIPDGSRPATRPYTPLPRSSPPLVLYVGHLYPWKGVDVLLRALAQLPHVRGLIVGGHPAEEDLQRLQALGGELGLTDRVRFTGQVPRDRVPQLLEQADVVVMPHTSTPLSERHASPLKLFEYMAAGRPIVASDLQAVREVLRDGENSCLVRAADPDALASGIAKVLSDVDASERIARTAFSDASDYTWDRRAERLESLLEQAMRRS